jgi:dipeptidyl aminopeptidase/acylaminoacyl peptidase
VRSTGDLTGDLYVVAVGPDGKPAGRPVRLDNRMPAFVPVWTADGTSVIVRVGDPRSNGGVARIRADGAGGLQRLGGLDYATSFALSRDDTALVFSRGGQDFAVWRLNLQDPATSGPIVPSTLWDANAASSPDGRRLAFESNRSGASEIWVADASGDNAQALTSFDGPIAGTPRWSPDSRTIAFDATLDGDADIFTVPAGGGAVRQLTKTPGEDARPPGPPMGAPSTSRRIAEDGARSGALRPTAAIRSRSLGRAPAPCWPRRTASFSTTGASRTTASTRSVQMAAAMRSPSRRRGAKSSRS